MQVHPIRTRLYYAALWLVAILFFLPILWIVLAALKTNSDILAYPPKWIFTPTMDNFKRIIAEKNNVSYFINSVLISVISVAVAIIVSFLAAYSFSRFKPAATDFLMFLLLSTRMVPGAAAVIPLFQLFNLLGLKDTFLGAILLYGSFSIPFSVWILKGFIDGVSPRYDETGFVNCASRLHVLFRVVLPQVFPGIIAAFIFNLIFVWNEFLFNYIIGGPKTQMIPYALAVGLVNAGGNVDWAYVSSLSIAYMILPIIAIFLFQRFLLVGMTFGTVRGEV